MGGLGSKDLLSQIVTIYGSAPNDFAWRHSDDRTMYHTTGLVVECHGKKYVITTRSRMSSCQNLVAYHNSFSEREVMTRHHLSILFQSIEFNVLILGSVGKPEFDMELGQVISGPDQNQISKPLAYDILGSTLVLPAKPKGKRKVYYTVRMNVDLESDRYDTILYSVKFIRSIIHSKTYLPPNFMYEFELIKDKDEGEGSLTGICGSVIFNKVNNRHLLVGIISGCMGDELLVLPTRVLAKVVNDFVRYIDRPEDYAGMISIPINPNLKIKCKYGPLNPDDKLLTVNGQKIWVEASTPMINDPIYNSNIPLEIYLRVCSGPTIDLSISRSGQVIHYSISNCGGHESVLTAQPSFFPENAIPYAKFGPVIICQLTHELIDITSMHKIKLGSDIVDEFIDSNLNQKLFVVIDCEKEMGTKYNLPQLEPGKKLRIASVSKVNNRQPQSLEDFRSIPQVLCLRMGEKNFEMKF